MFQLYLASRSSVNGLRVVDAMLGQVKVSSHGPDASPEMHLCERLLICISVRCRSCASAFALCFYGLPTSIYCEGAAIVRYCTDVVSL